MELPPSYFILYSTLHISLFFVQEIIIHVLRALSRICCQIPGANFIQQDSSFFSGKVTHNFENIILYIPKSDVVLVTQLIIIIVLLMPLYSLFM